MSGNNPRITTIVQKGETISLYSKMYGCTDEEIRRANGINGDKIKEGQTIKIPIGKKWAYKTSENNVLDKKLSWYDNNLNEVHMRLYNPKLKPKEREKLEAEYIRLVNNRVKRLETASIKKSADGKGFDMHIKKDITVSEFRKLYPECTTNFYEYADDTKQLRFIQGKGFYADPNYVTLRKGANLKIGAGEYARDDGDGIWRTIKLALGWRLDGK